MISSATCAIGALILSFGPPMPAFVFGMAVLGVGISMCRVIAVCILVQYRENAVIGIMYGFSSIGQTTAPFLLRLIQKVTTWKHFFWIIMAYFAIIGIMQFFVLKDVVLYGSKGDLLPIRQKWHGILTDKKLWKRIMSLTLSQLITESLVTSIPMYVPSHDAQMGSLDEHLRKGHKETDIPRLVHWFIRASDISIGCDGQLDMLVASVQEGRI